MDESSPPQPRETPHKDYSKRKLFVGGLSLEATDTELREFMQQFGEIVEATVIKDKHSKKSRGFGFVTFRRKRVARQLLSTPLSFQNQNLELNLAEPKVPTKLGEVTDVSQISKVFVGGIPKTATNESLLECFSKYGEIVEATLVEDKKTLQQRGFGFVVFANAASAQAAMNDYKLHQIQSKWVECKIALPKLVHEINRKSADPATLTYSSSSESQPEEVPDLPDKLDKHQSVDTRLVLSTHKSNASTDKDVMRSLQLPNSKQPSREVRAADGFLVPPAGPSDSIAAPIRKKYGPAGTELPIVDYDLRVNRALGTSRSDWGKPTSQTPRSRSKKHNIALGMRPVKQHADREIGLLMQTSSAGFHPICIRPPSISGYSRPSRYNLIESAPLATANTSESNAYFANTQARPAQTISNMQRNYRFNLQQVLGTRYCAIFEARTARPQTVAANIVNPTSNRITRADQPARVFQLEVSHTQISENRTGERSLSRLYTPFGHRESSKRPTNRANSIRPLPVDANLITATGVTTLNTVDSTSLTTIQRPKFQNKQDSAPVHYHPVVSVIPTTEEGPALHSDQHENSEPSIPGANHNVASTRLSEGFLLNSSVSQSSRDIPAPMSTDLADQHHYPTVAPETETKLAALHPVAEASPQPLNSLPTFDHGLADFISSNADALNPKQQHDVFPTPASLADGFDWDDQFSALRQLTGKDPVALHQTSGSAAVRFLSDLTPDSSQTLLQAQADLKLKLLRDNISAEHAEELDRTKLTLAGVISQKSKPGQRTGKGPNTKGPVPDAH